MNTIDIIKGNSFSFSVSVPIDKVSQINEIVVSIADVVVAKKSDDTLVLADGFTNKYIVELSSQYTQSQRGSCLVTVAIDFDDLGVRKSSANDGLMLRFIETQNGFNNEATSEILDAALVFSIDVDTITTQVELATVMRGYNTLEMFRVEKNLPNATFDEMMTYYYFVGSQQTIPITNKQDGNTINHILNGKVIGKFINTDGSVDPGVWVEYASNSSVIFRTPILDDVLNTNYNGWLICEKYSD